jgi:2-dehydro-3-deoxyphosphooctonate aldolase (KDO 8-P synthase)
MRPVQAGAARFDGTRLGVIAGPCVIEDPGMVLEVAAELRRITDALGLPFVFKASYAKDNRSSGRSYRGPGAGSGLRILGDLRERLGVPVLSDVHTPEEVPAAAAVLDVLQIPAFLCRQTSLLEAAGRAGKPVNIKKGQFLAPEDLGKAVDKVREAGSPGVLVTERGTAFGYHNLVVDMRSLCILAETGCPVVYDATHSLQLPGAGEESGGLRQFARPLARAAVAAGAHAVFFETHPDPDRALSDRATQLALAGIPDFLEELTAVWNVVHATAAGRSATAAP